mgnify:CR=1 FL=1
MKLAALLKFEWTKLLGRRLTWVPFIVLMIVVTIIVTVFYNMEFKHFKRMVSTYQITFGDRSEFVNGYFMTASAMNPIFQVLIPIFVAIASGLMVASESEQGTLRAALVRPITRRQLIFSKFLMLAGYSLAVSLFLVMLLLVAGTLNFGTGNLYTLNFLFNNGQDGVSTVLAEEAPLRFLLAGLLASLGMTVLAALALLVSSLVETAAMAYVITLSIYFAALTLRSLPFLDWLYPYLFVTHMLRWQQCFYSHIKTGEIWVSIVHLAGYLVALLAASMLLFEERDVKS